MTRTPIWAETWTVLRLVMALAALAAILAQAQVTFAGAVDTGKDVGTTVANFFSFFTILSNVGTVIVLAWAAIWHWTRPRGQARRRESRALAIVLAAVTSYMILTGVVYNTLLRNIPLPQGSTVPWSNEVLHVVGPIFLLLDLFVGPFRRSLPWRGILEILAFPLLWVVYTLIRGPLTVDPGGSPPYWYPYPFLNPNRLEGGYAEVAAYVVGIAIAIGLIAWGVIATGRRRGAVPTQLSPARERSTA